MEKSYLWRSKPIFKMIAVIITVVFTFTSLGIEKAEALSPHLQFSRDAFSSPYMVAYATQKADKIIGLLAGAGSLSFASIEDLAEREVFLKKDIAELDFAHSDGEIIIEIADGMVLRIYDPAIRPDAPANTAPARELNFDKKINDNLSVELLYKKDLLDDIVYATGGAKKDVGPGAEEEKVWEHDSFGVLHLRELEAVMLLIRETPELNQQSFSLKDFMYRCSLAQGKSAYWAARLNSFRARKAVMTLASSGVLTVSNENGKEKFTLATMEHLLDELEVVSDELYPEGSLYHQTGDTQTDVDLWMEDMKAGRKKQRGSVTIGTLLAILVGAVLLVLAPVVRGSELAGRVRSSQQDQEEVQLMEVGGRVASEETFMAKVQSASERYMAIMDKAAGTLTVSGYWGTSPSANFRYIFDMNTKIIQKKVSPYSSEMEEVLPDDENYQAVLSAMQQAFENAVELCDDGYSPSEGAREDFEAGISILNEPVSGIIWEEKYPNGLPKRNVYANGNVEEFKLYDNEYRYRLALIYNAEEEEYKVFSWEEETVDINVYHGEYQIKEGDSLLHGIDQWDKREEIKYLHHNEFQDLDSQENGWTIALKKVFVLNASGHRLMRAEEYGYYTEEVNTLKYAFYSEPDENGNIFYSFLEEDIDDSGCGRVSVSIRKDADENGAKAFKHIYKSADAIERVTELVAYDKVTLKEGGEYYLEAWNVYYRLYDDEDNRMNFMVEAGERGSAYQYRNDEENTLEYEWAVYEGKIPRKAMGDFMLKHFTRIENGVDIVDWQINAAKNIMEVYSDYYTVPGEEADTPQLKRTYALKRRTEGTWKYKKTEEFGPGWEYIGMIKEKLEPIERPLPQKPVVNVYHDVGQGELYRQIEWHGEEKEYDEAGDLAYKWTNRLDAGSKKLQKKWYNHNVVIAYDAEGRPLYIVNPHKKQMYAYRYFEDVDALQYEDYYKKKRTGETYYYKNTKIFNENGKKIEITSKPENSGYPDEEMSDVNEYPVGLGPWIMSSTPGTGTDPIAGREDETGWISNPGLGAQNNTAIKLEGLREENAVSSMQLWTAWNKVVTEYRMSEKGSIKKIDMGVPVWAAPEYAVGTAEWEEARTKMLYEIDTALSWENVTEENMALLAIYRDHLAEMKQQSPNGKVTRRDFTMIESLIIAPGMAVLVSLAPAIIDLRVMAAIAAGVLGLSMATLICKGVLAVVKSYRLIKAEARRGEDAESGSNLIASQASGSSPGAGSSPGSGVLPVDTFEEIDLGAAGENNNPPATGEEMVYDPELEGDDDDDVDEYNILEQSGANSGRSLKEMPDKNKDLYEGLPEDEKLSIDQIIEYAAEIARLSEFDAKDKAKEFTKETKRYIADSKEIVADKIKDNDTPVLLRVPLEALENPENEGIVEWMRMLSETGRIYVELYTVQSPDADLSVDESIYERYGLRVSSFPEESRVRSNVISLFTAERGLSKKEVSAAISSSRNLKESIIVPMGIKGDPTGAIRATLFGFRLVKIARGQADAAFVQDTINRYESLVNSYERKSIKLTVEEITAIATGAGSINVIVNTLVKIIATLPIEKFSAEDLRELYENALSAAHAA